MNNTDISVNKQTILQLLISGQEVPFVIPEYQRPYSWSDDEIITLFDDLWEFSIERTKPDSAKTYFLGCVVSYETEDENKQKERQIIDGQQRITSLFLLLRAVFAMLEQEENKTKEVNNFISKIMPALWKADEKTGDVDRNCILLRSDVVTDSGNQILRNILQTGIASVDAKDNYSRNYNKFIELYSAKSKNSPLHIYDFILALLNYSILLPITADDQETALTIFNTLNNRGLPLSDADIFKSYIYKNLDEANKKVFIQKWKQLENDASAANETIQSLFYYHMFYLRAKEGDDKSTTPGVRKYYLDKKANRLTIDVIDYLIENLHLWEVVNNRQSIDTESWSQNIEIRKALDCLSSYNNEFWKYPVSIFYMTYKGNKNFEEMFLVFLRKLFVMLITRYMEVPTINAVKTDILKMNVNIISTDHPDFDAGFENKHLETEDDIKRENERTNQLIIKTHKNVIRALLKVLAYQNKNQTDLLPAFWEIEHIFPQTWDSKYYNYDEKETNELLEHLGNKLPLEKKLNISASNNYFDKKKGKYKESKIALAKDLGNSSEINWDIKSIIDNDAKVCSTLKQVFTEWIDNYNKAATSNTKPTPTPEEMEMITMLRNKGLI